MEQKTYTLEEVQAAIKKTAESKMKTEGDEVECCIKCAIWIAEEISKHM